MKKVLMKGNEAICQGALLAGCKAYFGYPITPQSEIPEYMVTAMPEHGGVFVQAESEVAAVNMLYGAAATGVRSMTSSSSPGMALKQEGISYLAGADLPSVLVNVSRGGPGLGGILPSQADYFQATRGGGNGDYYLPVLAPASAEEAMQLMIRAFDLADTYRTPVMVLIDGLLGQMMEPVTIPETGSGQTITHDWAANGNQANRERNTITSLNLSSQGLEQQSIERFARYETIKQTEATAENQVAEGDTIAIVAYGTPARIVKNAIEILKQQGINAGLIRPITLWPFPDQAFQTLPASVTKVLVCELSMGQMVDDVKLAVAGRYPVDFYGRTGGQVFTPEEIVQKVKSMHKEGN